MLPISLSSSSIHSLTPEFSWLISSSTVSRVFLPLCRLPFHHLQFLSNLLQYSWSYLLSDYPNSFLAVNLPSNSSLLNVPFLYSCLAISSMSRRYSLLNSSIASFAFFKFTLPSQVSDFAVNPFHHTKYLSFLLTCCLFRILSTSYSFSPSIITGAGCSLFCPSTCPMYLRILLMFTTGCIFTVLGSCKGNQSGILQEISQLIIVYEILLQPTSRRFLRELDEAPGGNNLHYILQCLCVPASVTRV